jgi:2-C-methyl-D-erythritol 4-phosphate cytidylyltransferase
MNGRGTSPDGKRVAAVVVAAGSSTRMGGVKKEYRPFGLFGDEARTVLAASVASFAESGLVDLIVVVTPPNGEAQARAALPPRLLSDGAIPAVKFVPGGSTRRQSVHSALRFLAAERVDFVHIHDGARPWLDVELIARLDAAVRADRAVIPVMPLVETPKEIAPAGTIVRHLKRATVVSAQTPQTFEFGPILAAHEQAAAMERAEGIEFTDDAEVWSEFVGQVRTVPGQASNKKITFPDDLPPPPGGAA